MNRAILDALTPEQKEAVTHIEGPLLVLAGPGSGKTRVITHRIAYLLEQGIPDHQILGITFTNKAAREMADRLDRLVPGHQVWLGTFHKFCVRLLRRYAERAGIDENFVIYDTSDRQAVIKQVMDELGIDRTSLAPKLVETMISRAKNDFILPKQFAHRASSPLEEAVAKIYNRYETLMREQNALDFDDLLVLAATLLADDQQLRSTLDQHLRFILVDEYQDTNEVQYRIVRLLSQDEPHLCVTGDPDQSIYGWRGANIKNILRFERDYPNCRVVRLEQNFRSTASILEAANQLIRHNRMRKRKVLRTTKPKGQPVAVRCYANEHEEAEAIAAEIKQAVTDGRRTYGDFAIFCRIGALTRLLERALRAQGVPYQILSGVAFFERMEIKDVLAYLRLLVNPRDNVSFLRAIKSPPRGVGDTTLKRLTEWADALGLSCLEAAARADQLPGIRPAQRNALRAFAELFQRWRQQTDRPLAEQIRAIIDESGYLQWVAHQPEGEERQANIEELVTAAAEFEEETDSRTLADFLATSALTTDLDRWDPEQGAVSLMTLHAAKGLEFPVVYIVAVEEDILPHARSADSQEQLEEERRLLFVGITRAQEELYLSYARERSFRGMVSVTVPSQFLNELGIPVVDCSGRLGTHGDWDQFGANELHWLHSSRPNRQTTGRRSRSRSSTRRTMTGGTGATGAGHERAGSQTARAGTLGGNEELAIGTRVRHDRYGIGYVICVEGQGQTRRVRVAFSRHGVRSFLATKAKLEILR